MIKGKIKEELTMDNILSKISTYDIYRFYMSHKDWSLNKITNSPFSKDDNPSFLIGNKYGELSHIAFNDTSKRGDCFGFVQQLFSCSLHEALKKIDSDFGLGLSNSLVKDYKKIISTYEQPKITKRTAFIQVVTRKFTKEELTYWNEYFQDITDLRNNNIYSIKTLYLNKQKFPLKETELRFGYYYKSGHWKLYRPFADKRSKWLSNVPLTTSWGIENLNKDHNSIIAKSLKDYMVIRKIYPYVTGVQNESLAAFSDNFVDYIKNNSKEIFCSFDSDNPGKNASFAVTKAFKWKHVNPPDNLLPDIKDMADWARLKGLDKIKEHFTQKGIF